MPSIRRAKSDARTGFARNRERQDERRIADFDAMKFF